MVVGIPGQPTNLVKANPMLGFFGSFDENDLAQQASSSSESSDDPEEQWRERENVLDRIHEDLSARYLF